MAEKKKPRPPKPGPSTGGSSTSRIKKPKGTQPLTLGTGLRTSKVSKKQQAGTRKVVGAIAAVTPVGRAAKAASKIASKAAKVAKGKKTPTAAAKPAKKAVQSSDDWLKSLGKEYSRTPAGQAKAKKFEEWSNRNAWEVANKKRINKQMKKPTPYETQGTWQPDWVNPGGSSGPIGKVRWRQSGSK